MATSPPALDFRNHSISRDKHSINSRNRVVNLPRRGVRFIGKAISSPLHPPGLGFRKFLLAQRHKKTPEGRLELTSSSIFGFFLFSPASETLREK
jgi:hypothetical protein